MYLAPAQPPRQRLPGRVYATRRVVAAVTAVAVLFLVYSVATAVFGAPDRHTDAATAPPSTSLIVSDGKTPLTAASTSTTTTELLPKPKTTPTSDNPAVLYVAGDSDAGTFGPYLDKLMKQTGMVKTTLDYKISSGLSRPDFFDWPSHFAQQIPAVTPDIVVVTFGGNDAQGLRNKDATWAVDHSPGSGTDDADWRGGEGERGGGGGGHLAGGEPPVILGGGSTT